MHSVDMNGFSVRNPCILFFSPTSKDFSPGVDSLLSSTSIAGETARPRQLYPILQYGRILILPLSSQYPMPYHATRSRLLVLVPDYWHGSVREKPLQHPGQVLKKIAQDSASRMGPEIYLRCNGVSE